MTDDTSTTTPQSSVLWNKLVLSILITETAERVAYFGFRAILVLYFTHGLQFSESTAISLCAGTVALAYLSPLVGAVLADSIWGRFPTIWNFGGMYVVGLWLLTFASYRVPNYNYNDNSDELIGGGDEVNQENNDLEQEDQPNNLGLARTMTFFGLFLVCMGTGGIKPCVSAFGADQVVLNDEGEVPDDDEDKVIVNKTNQQQDTFEDEPSSMNGSTPPATTPATTSSSNREERIREFFNSFYFCINVGALASFAIIPIVRARWGFGAAFLIPTLFMMAALLIFGSQRKNYKHRKRDETQPSLFRIFQVSIRILKERFFQSRFILGCCYSSTTTSSSSSRTTFHSPVSSDENDHDSSHDRCDDDRENQVYQDASQALHILPLMAFFPIFWMLYDQQGSVWTLQATRLNLYGLEPEQLNVLNPLEIMIFIPLFDVKIYPWLEHRGFNIQPLRRMEYGMFLTAISFAMSTWLEHYIQSQPELGTVSLAWQIPQITTLTVAEILLNVTGLEFAYSQAPSNMQALILALYLFMTAIGDGFGALLYASVFASMSVVKAMMLCCCSMLVNMCCFSMVARRWKPYHSLSQEQEVAPVGDAGLELGPVSHVKHQG